MCGEWRNPCGVFSFVHYGAREYDPGIGQFISVDPLLETDKPQTLNGYSYAANSPVTHSDPTGLGLACGGAGGAQEACPTRPDGTPGNGRPNEAVDYTKSGTSSSNSAGNIIVFAEVPELGELP